jgi:tetratricopeptide (TPR) repeat protein
MALYNLGLALYDQGNLAGSRAAFEEALAIRRQQRDKNNTAQVLAALAPLALAEGKTADAHNQIAESIALREQLGELISLAQSKLVLADILLEEHQPEAAETTAREATVRFRGAHADGWEAEAELAQARAQLARGNTLAARESTDRAARLLRESKDVFLVALRDRVWALTEVAMGRKQAAIPLLERVLADTTRIGLLGMQFETRLALVEAGAVPAAPLAADARAAGFLRIARLAGSESANRPQ